MAVSESQWREPDASGPAPAGQAAPATAGQPRPVTAGMPAPVGAARQSWPGAIGPPVIGPPPRMSASRPPTPAAQYGAWQGALRPPVFVVSQPRPTYREPLPVRSPMVTAGAAAGAAWMLLFGLLATSARGYIWLTLIAGILAWGASAALARFGDRGVAVGVAIASGVAVAIAGIVVGYRMAGGDWLLW
ncbi:hypothetical protein GCM10010399_41170 [Dactylosporangium fulvum]|uniref:Uncharacterized protein n=1 Tax=Dactylosporangium fulvum TaxID=53359 RepID=A0ABY5VWZ7_9ACTN|nr:hypothetical protein [Dactylosporangium fulvum]UWP82313.1 hypothetical protein Dfulv_45905 [Dactylosporangium fulvum]